MVKMEFLKRKHFSLWIITTTTIFVLFASSLDSVAGLQGVPTWICLGLKSPFIEFGNEREVLANTSIPLNITKDEQAYMHQEGLRKLGTFIKPVDLRDSETGYVKANLTKKIPTAAMSTQAQRRIHPIQEEMDQKQIILLDEDTDENGLPASLTDEDRKFIVPMALKNASPDPRWAVLPTTPRTTTTTTRATTRRQKTTPASDIDDLKKHILFLQNMTKHDSSFQSKFVVFPSLKDKGKSGTATTTRRPMRPIFQYAAPISPPARKVPQGAHTPGERPFGGYYHNEEHENSMSSFIAPGGGGGGGGTKGRDKIGIVSQVHLLNEAGKAGTTTSTTTTTTTTTSTTTTTTTTTTEAPKRPTKRPPCLRNPDSPKCIRQRKREEQQRQRDRDQWLREQAEYLKPHFEPFVQTINNTKRFAVSIEIPDSFKMALNAEAPPPPPPPETELQLLSRSSRASPKRRNIGGGLQGRAPPIAISVNEKFGTKYNAPPYFERDIIMTSAGVASERDIMLANLEQFGMLPNASTPSPTVAAYSEPIDLNPDHCYAVEGLSYGQKKQCVLHTSVMPAISRGARATIQECQFQFEYRRWNCSTNDDNTVFGPMTGLGSPEMAFIHALAAATVTSFIARACRDGQLASCGCSRGSRPKQLHDDWSWGGCGDNLEYAYKFATDFIDVREKETRRGTRGAGNPERKRARQQQRRNQLQQAMQADDATAAAAARVAVATSNNVKVSTEASTMKASEQMAASVSTTTPAPTAVATATATADNGKNQQRATNKTVDTTRTSDRIQVASAASSSAGVDDTSSKNANDRPTISLPTFLPSSSVAPPKQEYSSEEDDGMPRIKPEDLLELQERITKEILNSKLQEKEMLELQEKINREILNSKVFNNNKNNSNKRKRKRKNQRAVNGHGGGGGGGGGTMSTVDAGADALYDQLGGGGGGGSGSNGGGKLRNAASIKARSLMNLHNNEAGRRAVIKKTRITCKCHGVSGSCSLITCWQQLSSIREIGDYLREKYEESTEVKLNKRGRLQVKDPQFKVPTAHDLVHLDESPDWCRNNRQLQWPGTHGRVCNKTSSGLDGCGILCCGRGYNTKNIVVKERCNCKFHWCCQVKCDVCVKVLEEHTCK